MLILFSPLKLFKKGIYVYDIAHYFNLVGTSLRLLQVPTVHLQLIYETCLES